MRIYLLLLLVAATAAQSDSALRREVSRFDVKDEVLWGSLSAHQPRAGFYGQKFAFDKTTIVDAIAVFVYDHPDHDESGSTVSFGVWGFVGKPDAELFLSQPIVIDAHEVGQWKTVELADELSLEAGEYLIGAGQQSYDGFVAFGNARAMDSAKQGIWMTTSYPWRPDGSSGWYQVSYAPPSAECPTAGDCALMIKLVVSDAS